MNEEMDEDDEEKSRRWRKGNQSQQSQLKMSLVKFENRRKSETMIFAAESNLKTRLMIIFLMERREFHRFLFSSLDSFRVC